METDVRTCPTCDAHTYQTQENHRVDSCLAQPTCYAGEKISADSSTQRRTCNACAGGQYQGSSGHRSMSCSNCGFDHLYSASNATECATCDDGSTTSGGTTATREFCFENVCSACGNGTAAT